jgi:hypothetical protein
MSVLETYKNLRIVESCSTRCMSVWWNSGVDGRDGEEERPGVGEVSGLGCQLSPEGNAPQRRLLRLRWHLLSITNYQFVNIYNEARDTSTSWCTHTSSIPSDWWMIVGVELAPVEPQVRVQDASRIQVSRREFPEDFSQRCLNMQCWLPHGPSKTRVEAGRNTLAI